LSKKLSEGIDGLVLDVKAAKAVHEERENAPPRSPTSSFARPRAGKKVVACSREWMRRLDPPSASQRQRAKP